MQPCKAANHQMKLAQEINKIAILNLLVIDNNKSSSTCIYIKGGIYSFHTFAVSVSSSVPAGYEA